MELKSPLDQTQFAFSTPASGGATDLKIPVDLWHAPAVIAENNFVHKSLSNWAFNVAVGCTHACRFCYVPDAATIKQGPQLATYGVRDADAEWGKYLLLRRWNETKFLASLRMAENTPRAQLKPDGNRAIIYCSTTDPYQVVRHPDSEQQKMLSEHLKFLVCRSLELIRDHSTLNVRILTRSPLAKRDFDLFASFGKRLTFGISLPTLRNDLARIYEPKAPAPSQRLATLQAARDAGLHVFVALAPTYPECNAADLEATLTAVAELDPITIFHEALELLAQTMDRLVRRERTRSMLCCVTAGYAGKNDATERQRPADFGDSVWATAKIQRQTGFLWVRPNASPLPARSRLEHASCFWMNLSPDLMLRGLITFSNYFGSWCANTASP